MARQRRLMNQINVVPYIDVMLVLLVIFMVTATMLPSGTVDLPSVAKTAQTKRTPLEVIVRSEQDFALRDRAAARPQEEKLPLDAIIKRVQKAQQDNAEQAVVIAADRNVRYEAVMKVMDRLQKADVKKVGLLLQQGS